MRVLNVILDASTHLDPSSASSILDSGCATALTSQVGNKTFLQFLSSCLYRNNVRVTLTYNVFWFSHPLLHLVNLVKFLKVFVFNEFQMLTSVH